MIPPEIRLDPRGDIREAALLELRAKSQLDRLHEGMDFHNLTQDVSRVRDQITGHEITCYAYRTPLAGFQSFINIFVPPVIPEAVEEAGIEPVYNWYVLIAIGPENTRKTIATGQTSGGYEDQLTYYRSYFLLIQRITPGKDRINSLVNALESPPSTVDDIEDSDPTWMEIREILFWMFDGACFVGMPYLDQGSWPNIIYGFQSTVRNRLITAARIFFDKWEALPDVTGGYPGSYHNYGRTLYSDMSFDEKYFVVWDVENKEVVAGPGGKLEVEAQFSGLELKRLRVPHPKGAFPDLPIAEDGFVFRITGMGPVKNSTMGDEILGDDTWVGCTDAMCNIIRDFSKIEFQVFNESQNEVAISDPVFVKETGCWHFKPVGGTATDKYWVKYSAESPFITTQYPFRPHIGHEFAVEDLISFGIYEDKMPQFLWPRTRGYVKYDRFDVETAEGIKTTAIDVDDFDLGSKAMFKCKRGDVYGSPALDKYRGVEFSSDAGCLQLLPLPDPYWSGDILWFVEENHESGNASVDCEAEYPSCSGAVQIDSASEEFEQIGHASPTHGNSWERVIITDHTPSSYGGSYAVLLSGIGDTVYSAQRVFVEGTSPLEYTGCYRPWGSMRITAQNRSVDVNRWHSSITLNSYGDAEYAWHMDESPRRYECTISAEFQEIYTAEVPLGILADFTEIWDLRREFQYTGYEVLLANTQGSKIQFHHTKNRTFKGEYAGAGEKTGVFAQFFVHDSDSKIADFVENGYDKDPYDPNAGLLFHCNRLTTAPVTPSITGVKNLEVTPALTVLASIDEEENIDTIEPFSQVSHNLDFADAIKRLIASWKTEEGEEAGYDIELRVFRG